MKTTGILAFIIILFSCTNENSKPHLTALLINNKTDETTEKKQEQQRTGKTILERISPPKNYTRKEVPRNSFQYYLRTLKLKPSGSKVKYYNGATKPNNHVYCDVVDLKIGNRDLHQCADAVMRLRAEYLWNQKEYEKIHFNFTNGFRVDYSKWKDGNRIVVNGNKTYWNKKYNPSNTYQDFWNYMEIIFAYAGTASLEKELQSINYKNAEIGDVIIQGGSPGHAVIIVDKATNNKGENVYLLAQSYMPAQEIQILINPNNKNLSPWYEFNSGVILTPEWKFISNNIKRFKNE
ncbi:MAG: DUF4846 domain-containing protein [Flavobacteriales bacterium]|nr:DUF4846 domain-containing protein [Flavobacteriales bacterium]